MDIVLILFLSIVSVVTIFSTFSVLREIVREKGNSKRARIEADREIRAAMVAAIAEERAKMETMSEKIHSAHIAESAILPAALECAKTESASKELPFTETSIALEKDAIKVQEGHIADAEETVSFSTTQRRTLEEQYAELNDEQKEFYDQISAYAAAKEGSKCVKNQRYKEYKLGSARIVRLRIRRGILHCEFVMINRDFHNRISESKISIKEAATVIKVQNAAAVEVVLSSIDLAIRLIEEERAHKKQLARERRRQASLRAKQQNSNT